MTTILNVIQVCSVKLYELLVENQNLFQKMDKTEDLGLCRHHHTVVGLKKHSRNLVEFKSEQLFNPEDLQYLKVQQDYH